MTKYRLEMNEEQARCVVGALDLAMRIRLGQWKEIIEQCMKCEPDKTDEWCERRDKAERVLLEARNIVMPELKDLNSLHGSYGVYSMEETERAFNVLKAVRSAIAWHKKPNGGITVDFDRPRAINVTEEMPVCEVVDDAT